MLHPLYYHIMQSWQRIAPTQEQLRLATTPGFIIGLIIVSICVLASIFVLYTAGASWSVWAFPHALRALAGFCLMFIILLIPLRLWYNYAYLLYLGNVLLLLLLPLWGTENMGAQRWFLLGSLSLQPSEPMKVCIILALARYFHDFPECSLRGLFLALVITLVPVCLVMIQPDLGTALTILLGAGIVFFLAGVHWWKFASVLGLAFVSAPFIWQYVLHDFQKSRVLSFINPQADLLGSGYQLMQSKIAIGAGGLFGQGFLAGTQSILGFIPAKHTDFVFSLYAEQFGLLGSIVLLSILLVILTYGFHCAQASRSIFGKLVAMSLVSLWIGQSAINLAMVMGLLPVVGIPLPFFSYGGTSLWTTLIGFGLLLNVYLYQYQTLGRKRA